MIAGDQNSDPLDGDSIPGSIQQLTEHPLVNGKLTPTSAGAVEAATLQGGANATHRGDPKFDTADFADTAPGNLRADYVLPRKTLQLVDAGVFWPLQSSPLFRLTGVFDTTAFRGIWNLVGGLSDLGSPQRLDRRHRSERELNERARRAALRRPPRARRDAETMRPCPNSTRSAGTTPGAPRSSRTPSRDSCRDASRFSIAASTTW